MTDPIAKLKINTIFSQLSPLDIDYPGFIEMWSYLDAFLSYEIHNSCFIKAMSTKKFIREHWDGRNHLFNVKTGKFLTGLLPYVKETLQQYDIPYEIEDNRMEYSKSPLPLPIGVESRKYQEDAVNIAHKVKRGIIWARPRAGKTLVEIMLVQCLGLTPVLSICQSIDIARQTIAKFNQFLPEVKVGLIGDGECNIQPITIATIQSLSAAYDIKEKISKNQLEKIPAFAKKLAIQHMVETSKFVWVDECHHTASATHKYILQNKVYSAEYILGCSGTPFREDNTNLLIEGLLGPIIYEIDYSKLIDTGYLVRPTIHLIRIPKTIQFSSKAVYASIYKQAIVENDLRNNTCLNIAYSLKDRGKTCMILVNKINHGKTLADLIPCAKFSYSKSKDRESLWHQLKVGILPVLITTLGDEGIDIAALDATIIASGGESAIKVFQRLRCLTPWPGKTHAIVVDFMDPYKYLSKHSKKRERLYKSEPRFRITYKEVKLCP